MLSRVWTAAGRGGSGASGNVEGGLLRAREHAGHGATLCRVLTVSIRGPSLTDEETEAQNASVGGPWSHTPWVQIPALHLLGQIALGKLFTVRARVSPVWDTG